MNPNARYRLTPYGKEMLPNLDDSKGLKVRRGFAVNGWIAIEVERPHDTAVMVYNSEVEEIPAND